MYIKFVLLRNLKLMRYKTLLQLIIFTGCLLWLKGFSQAPSINISPGNDTTLCTGQVLPLSASVVGTGPGTSNYTVENIPFLMQPVGGTTVALSDDAVSNALPIGFTFCYFDNQYTQFYIGSNGWIGFSAGQPTTFTSNTIPNTLAAVPKNCIMGPWQDWHPGIGGTIRYQTTGVAPNRRLVVSFSNVPMFSCTTNFGTFQFVLHEGSNIIENHITNKPNCLAWAGGTATQGLHNANGTAAVVVPGRNNTVWTVTNNSVRYVPFGTSLPTITWTINGINAGSGNTINAFVTTGNPNRQYIARAQFGCSDLIIYDTVNVSLGNANANFTVTSPICVTGQTSTITYTGNASASATFTWNFDGGTIVSGTGQGPYQIQWATTGTKTVSLTVTTAGCQPGNFTQTVEVLPLPTSTFTVTNPVCQGQSSTITYTGNAPTGNFTWNFDGGTIISGTGAGPYEIQWNTSGTKNLSLSVGLGSCNSIVTNQSITVNPLPSSTFNISGNVCVGANAIINFTGTPIAGATYNWDFAGGTVVSGTGQGPYQVNWNTDGTKNVTLSVTANNCTSVITTNSLTVYPIPTSTFTLPANVCANGNATITYNGTASAGASYTWTFGGGTVVSGTGVGPYQISWTNAGIKNVTLTVSENGCVSQQTTNQITVNPIPTSFFTASAGVCVGENATITYTGTASAAGTYNWNFGTGTIASGSGQGPYNVNWPAMGNQTISLTVVENGCTSTASSQIVQVYETPTPNFTVTPAVCPNEPVEVTYTGNGTTNGNFNWNLSGGTGTPISGPGSFNVTFTNPGNQQLSLSVTENGCSSVPFNQTVTVNPVPTSNFVTNGAVCEGAPITVTYIGTGNPGATYQWNFDGATVVSGSGAGPYEILFNTSGNKNLTLTVIQNNCTSSVTTVIQTVNPIPTSSFTFVSPICLNESSILTFNGANAAPGAQYTWEVEGQAANTTNNSAITASWTTAGSKEIKLTVSSLGCVSPVTTHQVLVNPLPVVNAGVDLQSCSGIPVSMGTSSLTPGVNYAWTPTTGLSDPNNSITQVQLDNTTDFPNNITYTLTATDANGCSASDQVDFTVTQKPVVAFNIPAGQCFEGNSFNFTATGNFSNSANFFWNFGVNANVVESNLNNPSGINFSITGVQTITVRINDNGCESETFTADVIVFEEPTADFSANIAEGCRPLTIDFINNSQGEGTLGYVWNFGNFNQSTSINPKYTYTSAGLFDVFLVAVTANGCRDTLLIEDYINVYQKPTAIFGLNKEEVTMIDPTIRVTSLALNSDSCFYTIDSGASFDLCNFVYTFPDTGSYVITQYVYNSFGCLDSASRFVKVTLGYRIYVPNAFTPNADDLNDQFMVYGDGIEDFHIMIFNRWGEIMYNSYDILSGWDGTYKLDSGPAPVGVYNYVLVIRTKERESYTYRGTVTLLR